MTIRAGGVYLVGAGPGDPGLITVRGLELLRRADVVVHDRLIPAPLLLGVRADAEIIDAGKAPGRHTMAQDEINRVLVERAQRGGMVVRLKGGDPYVFGRGAEEAAACAAAGVACEVVPGVTSAIAGPALAGIPVTSRGAARHFAVMTAQTGAGPPIDADEWRALAGVDTLVVLMGVSTIGDTVRSLIGAGRDPSTPASIVERAGTPGQRRTDAPLGSIASVAAEAGVENPAVIVVGAAAAVGAGRAGPLAGLRVAVTRPRTASAELSTRLRLLGAEVVDCPLIAIEPAAPPPGWSAGLGRADWVVFTSRHGVRGFFRALALEGLDLRAAGSAKLGAVGPTTAAELRAHAGVPDLVPSEHRASALAQGVLECGPGLHVVFACGTLAREELPTMLRGAGCVVDEVVVYETRLLEAAPGVRRAFEEGVDAVLLASPSAARALRATGLPLGGALIGCIGPSTAAAAAREGLSRVFTAEHRSDEGLVEAVWARVAEMRA